MSSASKMTRISSRALARVYLLGWCCVSPVRYWTDAISFVAMIFVLTVHFKSDRWIRPQLKYLRRHISEPFVVWANLEGIHVESSRHFDRVVPSIGRHAAKLNLLAAEASAIAEPDDLLMFLDGDAFPVADPMPMVRDALSRSALVAVQRQENLRDVQPHPSFAVTTVETWRRIHGDWSAGHTWRNSTGAEVTDVGGNLIRLLHLAGETWTPILRSNTTDLHDLWFGVYGGVVYHHGAGFRKMVARVDQAKRDVLRTARIPFVRRLESRYRARTLRERVNAVHTQERVIFDHLVRDPDFWLQFQQSVTTR